MARNVTVTMTEAQANALWNVASRGIDELEAELDDGNGTAGSETRTDLNTAYRGLARLREAIGAPIHGGTRSR